MEEGNVFVDSTPPVDDETGCWPTTTTTTGELEVMAGIADRIVMRINAKIKQ